MQIGSIIALAMNKETARIIELMEEIGDKQFIGSKSNFDKIKK